MSEVHSMHRVYYSTVRYILLLTDVIVSILQSSTETKVSQFYNLWSRHQHIPVGRDHTHFVTSLTSNHSYYNTLSLCNLTVRLVILPLSASNLPLILWSG